MIYWIYSTEQVSGIPHPKTMLNARYVKFVDSLLKSRKPEVAFIASMAVNDNRTVMGKTMTSLKNELSCQVITPALVKTKLQYFPVPEFEELRSPSLMNLSLLKRVKAPLMTSSNLQMSNL